MSRRIRWFAMLVVVALAAPAAAVASGSGTTVTVKKWVVTTASHTKRVEPSSTVLVCRSKKILQLLITARVSGAVEGQDYQEHIFVDGQRRDLWHRKWKANDSHVPFGTANTAGLPVGQWSWRLTQAGETLAQTSLTIKSANC
jgi:hypothetical protein